MISKIYINGEKSEVVPFNKRRIEKLFQLHHQEGKIASDV